MKTGSHSCLCVPARAPGQEAANVSCSLNNNHLCLIYTPGKTFKTSCSLPETSVQRQWSKHLCTKEIRSHLELNCWDKYWKRTVDHALNQILVIQFSLWVISALVMILLPGLKFQKHSVFLFLHLFVVKAKLMKTASWLLIVHLLRLLISPL